MTLYAQVKKGKIRTIHDWEISPNTDNWINIEGMNPIPKIGCQYLGDNTFSNEPIDDIGPEEKSKAIKLISKININALEKTEIGKALKAILIYLKLVE
jgi:hypothetical protein